MPSSTHSFAMGVVKIVIIIWGLSFGAFAAEPNCTHDVRTFRCVKYIRNYDGDTVTVTIPNIHPLLGEKISVRILGVDAPEIKTKNTCEKQQAHKAKELVSEILKKAKRIDIQNIKRDKYFRIVGDIISDGQKLSQVLLKNNLAYKYDGGRKPAMDWCKDLNLEKFPATK